MFEVFFVCLSVLLLLYIIVEQCRRREDHIKCELIGGVSPSHLLLLSTTHINTCYVLLLFLTVPIEVSTTTSFEGLGNIARESIAEDILVEDQLMPPLDLITVG